ncbi:hypothetical protein H0H81_010682, partial [Sphagnurus paluster]
FCGIEVEYDHEQDFLQGAEQGYTSHDISYKSEEFYLIMSQWDNMTRSRDFWMHDGSIVLAVENTLFRVHQTILAHHSEIFSDLFSLPQAEEGEERSQGDSDRDEAGSGELNGHGQEERLEGCRVVVLHDLAADFDNLLRAIYHPS